jgi:hypothetical protein
MKPQIFHHEKYKSSKNPLKRTKILQDIITITNLKFQHKSNNHLSKSLYKYRPITQGPKSHKLLYSIMNLNTISLPTKARPTNYEKLMSCGKYLTKDTSFATIK